MDSRGQIANMIRVTGKIYGKTYDADVLSMMIDDLQDLPIIQIEAAFARYRRDPKNKFAPMPAQIRELIIPTPSDDTNAREAVSRIQEAVGKFGSWRGDEARPYVGELGWGIVKRMGGWGHLCENLGTTLDALTFQAQARELAKSHMELSRAGALGQAPALPEPESVVLSASVSGLLSGIKSIPKPEDSK